MQGRVDEAKAELRKAFDLAAGVGGDRARMVKPRMASVHQELCYLHRLTGDLDEAMKEIDETLQAVGPSESLPPVSLFAQKAIILLDMGRMDEFAKLADEIKWHIDRGQKPKLMKVYHYLLGRRELKTGDPRKAVDHLWRAVDMLSVPGYMLNGADPEYFYYLAEAMRLSRTGSPSQMYEKVTLPTVDHLHHGDLYAMSIYRLAKSRDRGAEGTLLVQTSRAGLARAAEDYRRFLALWGDADTRFAPLVEDARARLAAIDRQRASH
jgi:tetratricopeptide (TPR) repeat protein